MLVRRSNAVSSGVRTGDITFFGSHNALTAAKEQRWMIAMKHTLSGRHQRLLWGMPHLLQHIDNPIGDSRLKTHLIIVPMPEARCIDGLLNIHVKQHHIE